MSLLHFGRVDEYLVSQRFVDGFNRGHRSRPLQCGQSVIRCIVNWIRPPITVFARCLDSSIDKEDIQNDPGLLSSLSSSMLMMVQVCSARLALCRHLVYGSSAQGRTTTLSLHNCRAPKLRVRIARARELKAVRDCTSEFPGKAELRSCGES